MAVDIPNGILKQSDVRETITNTEETGVGFDLDFARFDSKLDLSAGTITGLYIDPEGTELYICTTDDDVIQFTMSSRWDISTATLTYTLDVSAKETELTGLSFKPDGTKMYTVGKSGDTIDEYDLSIAWLLSSAVYLQEFDFTPENGPEGLFIREDGKQVYITGGDPATAIWALHLSTPWDITSAEQLDAAVSPPASSRGIWFNRTGSKLFIVTITNDLVNVWTLSTVFKLSTASADSTFKPFPSVSSLSDVCFSPDGSKMYLADGSSVMQYSIKRGWR